ALSEAKDLRTGSCWRMKILRFAQDDSAARCQTSLSGCRAHFTAKLFEQINLSCVIQVVRGGAIDDLDEPWWNFAALREARDASRFGPCQLGLSKAASRMSSRSWTCRSIWLKVCSRTNREVRDYRSHPAQSLQ